MAKSFFERLTGTLNLGDEEDQEKNTSPATKPENKKTKKKITDTDSDNENGSTPAIETKKTEDSKETEEYTPTSNEEWPEEAEGQLIVDVYQNPSEIVIKSLIAGVKPEDIDITVTNDMITIKGKRSKDETVKSDDYYYQECYWGAFSRSIILPVDVEADKADASIKNGILTIRLPKIEKVKTRKIKVKS